MKSVVVLIFQNQTGAAQQCPYHSSNFGASVKYTSNISVVFFLLGKVQGRIIFFQVLYLIWGKYCAVSWRFFGGAVVVIIFFYKFP